MKIETLPREDHQVNLVAEYDDAEFEKYKHQAARKISQGAKIPGFRPGKAPYAIVLRTYGEDAIQKEAIDLMIDETYPKVLDEAKVEPSGPGSLDDILSTSPLKLSFIVPLKPEAALGDYQAVRLPYTPQPLPEEEVDRFFNQIRNAYATVEPAERPAAEGDLVYLTINGRLLHPAEGEEAEVIKDATAQALVRPPEDQPETEWPFPGFGMQLAGLSAGDTKKLTFLYAEDADYESLRGKEVEFEATVQSVKAFNLPELNDEFVQSLGEYESLEAMRTSVRARLEENAREEYDKDYFSRLMDRIGEGAVLKYPPQMLDDEIAEVLRNVEHNLSHQGLDLETYLKIREVERDKFIEDEVKPVAVRRLERSLIMDEVARQEKIEVQEDEIKDEFNQTLADLQASGDLKQTEKRLGANRLANAIALEAISRLMNKRVLERLKSIANSEAEAAGEAPAEATAKTKKAPAKRKATTTPAAKETAAATTEKKPAARKKAAPATAKESEAPAAKKPAARKKKTEQQPEASGTE